VRGVSARVLMTPLDDVREDVGIRLRKIDDSAAPPSPGVWFDEHIGVGHSGHSRTAGGQASLPGSPSVSSFSAPRVVLERKHSPL
jgi:hypothetical protein